MVNFTPRQTPRYTLDRRMSGPQSRSGRGGEKKNSQPPQGIEPRSSRPGTKTNECQTSLSAYPRGVNAHGATCFVSGTFNFSPR
jgi:hypothetical protein